MADLKIPEFTNVPYAEMGTRPQAPPITPGTEPLVMDGDYLNVTNLSKIPVVFNWDNRAWVLEHNQTKPVLFEALVDALGDPRSALDDKPTPFDAGHGHRGVVQGRYEELKRMFSRYGVEQFSRPDLVEAAPHLKCETLDGKRVTFPATHPDMNAFPVVEVTDKVPTDISRMYEQISNENADMRGEIENLKRLMQVEIERREGVTQAEE
jgi:hypothetical protein